MSQVESKTAKQKLKLPNKFENIDLKQRNAYNKSVAFDQDLIISLEKEPKDLSTYTIIKQIQFLT